MEKQDILKMAQEAEIPFNKWGLIGCEGCEQDIDDALIRFATLVAASEREACAKACEEMGADMTALSQWGAITCASTIRAKSNIG